MAIGWNIRARTQSIQWRWAGVHLLGIHGNGVLVRACVVDSAMVHSAVLKPDTYGQPEIPDRWYPLVGNRHSYDITHEVGPQAGDLILAPTGQRGGAQSQRVSAACLGR